MIRGLLQSVEKSFRGAVASIAKAARASIKPKSAIGGLVADLTRTHDELMAENAALRQQVILLSPERSKRTQPGPLQ